MYGVDDNLNTIAQCQYCTHPGWKRKSGEGSLALYEHHPLFGHVRPGRAEPFPRFYGLFQRQLGVPQPEREKEGSLVPAMNVRANQRVAHVLLFVSKKGLRRSKNLTHTQTLPFKPLVQHCGQRAGLGSARCALR